MSTYKILISKNLIARASDTNIVAEDSETGTEDVLVTLFVNDLEIHKVNLTDDGACLMYTGSLAEGYHTIKVQPEAGKPTDIHIDRVLIDDNPVVGSQYLMETRIFGKDDDFMMYKCCPPFRSPKKTDHVWWGEVYSADYTLKSATTYYRPHVVTDLGEWWQWSFSVTAAGHIHWSVDESDSILYDSTENNIYYAAKSTLVNDSTPYPQPDDADIYVDSSLSSWTGPGTYYEDWSLLGDSSKMNTYDLQYIYSQTEWQHSKWYYMVYWPSHNIEPIVVS